MTTATRLAAWIGAQPRAVTPGGALRPADVPEAGQAVGVRTRAKVRRAADVPEIHRPWMVAVATGMITIAAGHATRSQRPSGTPEADPLQAWRAGLHALLEAEVKDVYRTDPQITTLVTLTVVDHQQPPEGYALQNRVGEVMYDRGDWENFWNVQLHTTAHPAEAALALLRLFGALDGMRLTPLGAWLRADLERAVPPQITPAMPADKLLDQLTGTETDAWNRARRWFGDRTTDQIATELLQAATGAPPAQRMTAIGLICGLGEDALPALRTFETVPTLAPHARAITHQYQRGPAPSTDDLVWLATEYTHADLTTHGTAAARYTAMEALDAAGLRLDGAVLKLISDRGHPQAAEVATALEPALDATIPAQQLKITLGPGCWRRVLVPENATLETLHQVIKALMGWGDDHLHVFTVGRHRYADEFHHLEQTRPEHLLRLHQALPTPRTTISYVYDLGDSWSHEILLEKVLDRHLPHPECIAGQGDNPIEDYNPEYPEDPVPFDREAINQALQRLRPVIPTPRSAWSAAWNDFDEQQALDSRIDRADHSRGLSRSRGW